jgi:hypothetical protein
LFGPNTLFPPTPDQLESIISFLSSSSKGAAPGSCPFPVKATEHNRPRWSHYHAAKYFNIYRNRYDHRLPEFDLGLGCVWRGSDWPELNDESWIMHHFYQVSMKEVKLDEAAVAAASERMKLVTPGSPFWCRVNGERYP